MILSIVFDLSDDLDFRTSWCAGIVTWLFGVFVLGGTFRLIQVSKLLPQLVKAPSRGLVADVKLLHDNVVVGNLESIVSSGRIERMTPQMSSTTGLTVLPPLFMKQSHKKYLSASSLLCRAVAGGAFFGVDLADERFGVDLRGAFFLTTFFGVEILVSLRR